MGSNRKQPFGYRMEMGRIVLNPEEAKQVRLLFVRYDQGDSLQTLADSLRQQGVPYSEDKVWNKNMVARILEDRRYIGTSDYPAIIPSEKFHAVAEKRSKRSAPIRQTEAQKILRQKCGKKPTEDVERQVFALLNGLIRCPARLVVSSIPGSQSVEVEVLEAKLEATLAELPVDMDKAKGQIQELAAARYQAIGPGHYETERLRRLFQQATPMEELDADLLRKTVATIQIDNSGGVKLFLKNRQAIQERENEVKP